MTSNPGKDDVHEQRLSNQNAEGVVEGGSAEAGGEQMPKAPPAKPAQREHAKSDAAAPPRTPDTINKPD